MARVAPWGPINAGGGWMRLGTGRAAERYQDEQAHQDGH